MNWKKFQEWCDTAPFHDVYDLYFDMCQGDFRYYDNCQREEGFYDNWEDFERRYKYLVKVINKRKKEKTETGNFVDLFVSTEKHDEFWDCVHKQTFRLDKEALKQWCIENDIFKDISKVNWGGLK